MFFVGDDNRVSQLTTYTAKPISIADLDEVIEAEPDKTKISVGVYVASGHGFVVVQGPSWCWEYDTTLETWHERKSYLKTYWRAHRPIYAFSQWLCGDNDSPTLCRLSSATRKELGNPLAMRVETGPFGAFPNAMRINEIEVYMTKGQSVATGHDPDETNAMIEISISRDGGNTWSNPRQVALGRQGLSNLRARSSIWGQAEVQGVRWRFDESAGINFGFMGEGMMQAEITAVTVKIILPAQNVRIDTPTGVDPVWYDKLLGLIDQLNFLTANPYVPLPDPTKSNVTRSINFQSGTTYTLALTDAGNICEFANASPVTVTIPLNATVAFPVGTQIDVMAGGAGKVTFAGAGGVTLKSVLSNKSLSAQEAAATLVKMATDTWRLAGPLIP